MWVGLLYIAKCITVVPLLKDHPHIQQKVVSQKRDYCSKLMDKSGCLSSVTPIWTTVTLIQEIYGVSFVSKCSDNWGSGIISVILYCYIVVYYTNPKPF